MGTFCGWLVSSFGPTLAEKVIADMLACRRIGADASHARVMADGGAIGARAGVVPLDLHQEGSLLVAAQGRPRWHATDLATHAERHGSAAAVAQAYRRYGNECLRHIAGSFAIAVIDARSASGLLAVDRMGIRPLCYANPAGRLVFGSTAESVAAHPDVG